MNLDNRTPVAHCGFKRKRKFQNDEEMELSSAKI